MQRNRSLDAFYNEAPQRPAHAGNGLKRTIAAVRNDFRNQQNRNTEE